MLCTLLTEARALCVLQVGWYRKHFTLPSEWAERAVWLEFEAVFHEATMWACGDQTTAALPRSVSLLLRLAPLCDVC